MSAYLDGLRMLARRDLSEAQIRERLARRGHSDSDIDEAIARLKHERGIDDQRVAAAIARTQTSGKGRGPLRATQAIERAGISRPAARRAVDEAFAEIDDEALLERALHKRLKGRTHIADDREHARLYRYLIGQGFDADRVSRLLNSRRKR